jgi:hypothetical protein
MVRLTLDHPWQIEHHVRPKAGGTGLRTRLGGWLRPAAQQEPSGLAARTASRHRLTGSMQRAAANAVNDESEPRRAA